MNTDLVCLLSAALVYCGVFMLAMRHAERTIPPAEREAEAKGYLRKRSTPPPAPFPPQTHKAPDYRYDSTSVMPNPPSDPPENGGSDPPSSA